MTTVAPSPEMFTAAAVQALSQWGLDGAAMSLIKYRENAVFAVGTGEGRQVLRLHRPGYHSDAALRSELAWIRALPAAGVSTPAVIPTRRGEDLAIVATPAGPVQCDLLGWVHGSTIGAIGSVADDIATLERTLFAAGVIAARIHAHSAEWTPPVGFVRQRWDLDGTIGRSAIWGYYGDLDSLSDADRAILDSGAEILSRDLTAFGQAPDRFGLIHADLLPENLLDDGTTVNVIDFDDCGYGWHMWEIATAIYWHFGEPSFGAARDAVIAGYRSVRGLPDTHVALLDHFLFLRALVYLGWIHTRSEAPAAQENVALVRTTALVLAERLSAAS